MERPLAYVPSGFGHSLIAILSLLIAACGGEEDCSVTDSCPNQSPNATISAPADGATVDEFQSVSFQGSASDPEDGPLTGADLTWSSSIDGAIGTGTSFSRDDLSPGAHTITLSASDSEGATGSATIDLTVAEFSCEVGSLVASNHLRPRPLSSSVSVGAVKNPAHQAAIVRSSRLAGVLRTDPAFTGSRRQVDKREEELNTVAIVGAPTATITSPTNQTSGAPHTVFEGDGVTFTGSATDAEDGALTGSSLIWTSNVDGQIGTGESFSTSALSPGMHTVTLTATDSDMNEGEATVLTIVKPPAAGGYQVHVRWSEGVELTSAQQTAVHEAVAKLESVITGDVGNIAKTEFQDIGTCGGAAIPKIDESVDDVIIYLEFVPIDGPNGTVGSAGPCFTRTGTALSIVGGMRFDDADLQTLEDLGLMDDIILHEMMHILGFGIFWQGSTLPFDYLEEPSDPSNPEHTPGMTDTHFTGRNACREFLSAGGDGYTGGAIVPVENDTTEFDTGSLDGHWRESVFDEEIMSTAANVPTNPLSRVTVGQFEDLGYTVDYGAADPYVQVFSIVLEPHADEPVIDLSGDIWRGELHEIGPDGSSRRIR